MRMGSLGLILKQLISVHLCVCPGIIVSGTMPKKPSGFTAVWEIETHPPPLIPVSTHPPPRPLQPTHSVFSHFPVVWKKNLFFNWYLLSSFHHLTHPLLYFSHLHAILPVFHSRPCPTSPDVNHIY